MSIHANRLRGAWKKNFPFALPLLIGVALGPLIAFLIVKEYWLALAALCLVPAVLLLYRYPLIAIPIWFLSSALIPVESSYVSYVWALHRALIPLALGLHLLSRILQAKNYPPVHLGRAELVMAIYLVVTAASLFLIDSAPLPNLIILYDRSFVLFAAYWLIRFTGAGAKDLKRFMPILLFVYLAEIVIGFWEVYAPGSLPAMWVIYRMGIRMSGTFGNPNFYAYLLLSLMAILLHYAMHHANRFVKVFLVLAVGLGLICVFLTYTRVCWLAALLVLAGLAFLYPKPIISLLVLGIFGMTLVGASSDELATATQRFSTEATIDSRVVLAHAGQLMFDAQPIFGWGFNSYDRYYPDFLEPFGGVAPTSWDINDGTSHNTYLTVLAETGIVGFILLYFPAAWCLVRTLKMLPRLPKQGFSSWRLLAVAWLSVIVFLIIGAVIDYRFSWFCMGMWWMTLGFIANMTQTASRPAASERVRRVETSPV
jgi:O-antigen ligase